MNTFVVGAVTKDERFVVTLNLKSIATAMNSNTERADYYKLLFNRTYALQTEIDAAIAQICSDDLDYLLPLWEEAKAAARTAKESFQTAANQRLRYINAELSADNEMQNKLRQLSNAKNNPPHPNSYPTADETAAWEQSVVDAQAAFDKAHSAVVDAAKESQQFFADLNSLERKFREAAAREVDLREKVERLQGKNKPVSSVSGLPTAIG